MSSEAFLDLDALLAIVQANVGERVAVAWSNTPELLRGPSGLDELGNPIAGVDGGPIAVTPVGGLGVGMRVELDTPVLSQVGTDETRRTYDAGTNTQIITQIGLRNFTLTMRVECEVFPSAWTVCERMRTRWYRKGVLAQLRALNIAMRRVGDVISMSVPDQDRRVIDAARLDVFLRYCAVEVDTLTETVPPGNWIETLGPDPDAVAPYVDIPGTIT